MIVRVQRQGPAVAPIPIPLPLGPESLNDRGLLQRWYILHRLAEEVTEARRYDYPVSIVVFSPMIVGGDHTADARVRMGALAARAAARATDLVGWLSDNDDILIVLPHTGRPGAEAAIDRWHAHMQTQTTDLGDLKWLAAAAEDAPEYESAGHLLAYARSHFRGFD